MFGGMLLLLIVNLINLVLNFVFFLGLGMAVSGVAIASVVTQWSGFLFTIWYINRPVSHIGVDRFSEISLFYQRFVTAMPIAGFSVWDEIFLSVPRCWFYTRPWC